METNDRNAYPRVTLDGNSLTLDTLAIAARQFNTRFAIHSPALQKMKKSRDWVEQVQQTGKPIVYGVNTGFGSKASVSISKDHLIELQRNLIMSHSSGIGEPLPIDIVRAAMILRANTLIKGYSGIRVQVVETLLKMLEKGIVPFIPEQGSVGASGDLAPLSHLALVISKYPADGKPEYSGKAFWFDPQQESWVLLTGQEAMQKAGIPRIILEAKEGLALNNGTQISAAILALTLYDAYRLVKQADIAMAMSLEALLGISTAFDERLHALRPHTGQGQTAENIRRLIEGSLLINVKSEKVQDAYSLRCHPQVIGSVRDTLDYIRNILEIEFNSSTDNPLIIPELESENKALSGGNFHAQPLSNAADFLSIVLCNISNISERRIFRLSDRHLNEGLPSFLIPVDGLESGLMIAQYTAAALTSENKSLAHPASVDTIPTCENQEDHVSMAPVAARKARMILENTRKIVAIEMLYAAQALSLRMRERKITDPKQLLGKGTYLAFQCIRREIPFLKEDRPVYRDLEKITEMVRENRILQAVEEAIGALK